jgi:hypothetical protein
VLPLLAGVSSSVLPMLLFTETPPSLASAKERSIEYAEWLELVAGDFVGPLPGPRSDACAANADRHRARERIFVMGNAPLFFLMQVEYSRPSGFANQNRKKLSVFIWRVLRRGDHHGAPHGRRAAHACGRLRTGFPTLFFPPAARPASRFQFLKTCVPWLENNHGRV